MSAPTWVGMTRKRYTEGRVLGPPRVAVLHATAVASYASDLAWLRKGGGEPPRSPVSCHYLIGPDGTIVQFVREDDTAWHTGAASWMVDGQLISGSHLGVARLNWLGVGVELSNPNDGRTPYPDAQVAAAAALMRDIMRRWDIPPSQLVRHLDISPGRKTDPAAFPWQAFRAAVLAAPPMSTPILGGPSIPATTLIAYLDPRTPHLTWQERQSIVCAYTFLGAYTSIGNLRPFAQAVKEASERDAGGVYRPFNSRRFRENYNPAGLGATNDGAEGARFATIEAGVAAQYAHLLCYAARPEALPPELYNLSLTSPRRAAVQGAFGLGSAPTWLDLNGKWAFPGPTYGQDILRLADEIARSA